ncbi:hypothetical protein QLQ85_14285 [Halomonas sp. M4R5S39]|uniref:COG4648 family protein n=1 Tax=Halomonas kalidii TaxID=3043293 RepID=UPI0024A8AE07|nr:hypothetical protein [Halomonas kalidii]MDI5985962.1 hypothetical protein [Halomonas kalidii]
MRGIKWLGMLAALGWPILVFALHGTLGSWPLLMMGAGLLAWRIPQARLLALGVAALLLAAGGMGHAELGMRAYPVAVNAIMLAIFLTSLAQGMPIAERLARLREPDLSAAGVRYTRRVTWAWCGFFMINGTLASWTVLYADLAVWSLYNGVISYGLIGLMFGSEWLLRQRLRRSLT